jgi:hypothetical protein
MERELPTEGARIFVTWPQTMALELYFKTNIIHSSGTESKENRTPSLCAGNRGQACCDEHGSRFPQGQAGSNQTPLPIKLDPFKPQHAHFPVAMGHRRAALGSRLVLFSTEPSDRSIRGDDSVAWDERSEGVIREGGADYEYSTQ